MSERRKNWEIHNLGIALRQAGINLTKVCYEANVGLPELEIMLRNHGEQCFTHKPIRKVEQYFLKKHRIQVEKCKCLHTTGNV
jgi:hypothetical protein